MAKRTWRIADFSGGIRQDIAESDLPNNAFTEITGFEIDKKGVLTRQLGWKSAHDISSLTGTPIAGISYTLAEPNGPKELIVIATDTPKLYVYPWWNGSAWTSAWKDLDDLINDFAGEHLSWTGAAGSFHDWFVRNGILRVAMGTNSETDYPIWFGIIKNKYFPVLEGEAEAPGFYLNDATEYHEMVCGPTLLMPPNWPHAYISAAESGSGTYSVPHGEYQFAFSYVYDGYQEGPLGIQVGENYAASTVTISTDNQHILVDCYVSYDLPNYPIDRRWTAIRVYMKFTPHRDESASPVESWTLLHHIPITEQFDAIPGSIQLVSGWLFESAAIGATTDAYRARIIINDISGLAGMTYFDSAGHTCDKKWMLYTYEKINQASNNVFVGNMKEVISDSKVDYSNEFDPSIRYAARQGWNGLIAPDVLPPLNFLPTQTQSGEGKIQSVKSLGGRAIIIRERSLTKVVPSEVTEYLLEETNTVAGAGCVAPHTVVEVENVLLFANIEGVWLYDGTKPALISKPIRDWWNTFTDSEKKDAFAVYFPEKRQYWIAAWDATTSEASARIFQVDLGVWIGHVFDTQVVNLFLGSDNTEYYVDSSNIYERKTGDDASPYGSNQSLISGYIDMDVADLWKRFVDFWIIHEGDAMKLTVEVDGTNIVNAQTLNSHTSIDLQNFHLNRPKGRRLKYTLEDADSPDLTKTIEIHELGIDHEIRLK